MHTENIQNQIIHDRCSDDVFDFDASKITECNSCTQTRNCNDLDDGTSSHSQPTSKCSLCLSHSRCCRATLYQNATNFGMPASSDVRRHPHDSNKNNNNNNKRWKRRHADINVQ